MNPTVRDDGWRIPDALWESMAPLLPARKLHPLGGHRPRIPDRMAMDGILLVLRTGMQWSALDQTGICTGSASYRRFREWIDAGVFQAFRRRGLLECPALGSIDWCWLPLGETVTGLPPASVSDPARFDRSRQRWRRAPPVERQ